jgi:serpin B
MDSHSPARLFGSPLADAALSRRALLGRAVLGASAAAGLGPRLARAAPATPAASVPDLVAGNTAFALALYAALRQNADLVPAVGNLLFSPYSVSQALAMTYAGARGETARQMAEVLGFALPQPALHAAFHALTADLVARGTAEQDPEDYATARALQIANGLWGEQSYPFDPAYTAQVEQYYGTSLQETDFIEAPAAARQEINAWVAGQTEERIQDIVPEGAITDLTRLVLANAIYFYGSWAYAFAPGTTADDDFFLLDGTTVTAPFMVQQEFLSYARGDDVQVIEFPYGSGGFGPDSDSGFTFTVILPDEGEFESFEQGLDAATFSAATGHVLPTDVLVYLPKFEFAFGAGLVPTLQSLGMTDAFDPRRADFTGMTEPGAPPETDPLFIGDVLHKAFISVDENGTEAAAATIVEMAAGAAPPEEEPLEVRIDRPFLFAIRDTQTGTLLFLGRVVDPSA